MKPRLIGTSLFIEGLKHGPIDTGKPRIIHLKAQKKGLELKEKIIALRRRGVSHRTPTMVNTIFFRLAQNFSDKIQKCLSQKLAI